MSEQELATVAKTQIANFNSRDWDAQRETCAADVGYDEAATHRKIDGVETLIELSQGWISAFPKRYPID